MSVDRKECRKRALFCTELAAAARSKALFLELSQSWSRLDADHPEMGAHCLTKNVTE